MRAHELRAGTLVNGERVVGKKPVFRNRQRKIEVTLAHPVTGDERIVTYLAKQNVPGSPRLGGAFLPAADTRRVHDGHQGRHTRHDRDEARHDRAERRKALRMALAAA